MGLIGAIKKLIKKPKKDSHADASNPELTELHKKYEETKQYLYEFYQIATKLNSKRLMEFSMGMYNETDKFMKVASNGRKEDMDACQKLFNNIKYGVEKQRQNPIENMYRQTRQQYTDLDAGNQIIEYLFKTGFNQQQ